MSIRFTLLGCGNSAGSPIIGNYWGKCDPNNPKNRRTRACASVTSATTSLIIDTGPDFKEQYNRSGIQSLSAVLYTHAHGDHANGIDELRTLQRRFQTTFPVYASAETLDDITRRFDYMFHESGEGFYEKVLEYRFLTYGQALKIGDIELIPFAMDHGTCTATGYRFGGLGYTTDMVNLDDRATDILGGIDVWIADAAAYHNEQNPVHATIEKVIALNEKIGAKKVYLTDLPVNMDYDAVKRELPDGYAPAYDGLVVETEI